MKVNKGFRFPGLYLWGTSAGVPRYVGKTAKTLAERITHRYVGNAIREKANSVVNFLSVFSAEEFFS